MLALDALPTVETADGDMGLVRGGVAVVGLLTLAVPIRNGLADVAV